MANSVNFTIKGEIQTKQRPRASSFHGFARVYTPEDTINYENYVRSEYQRQCNDFMFEDDKPLMARLTFFFAPNKEVKKMQENDIEVACLNNKDVDNLAKIILDALNGIAYDDDRRIISLFSTKCYSKKANEEYVSCEITENNHEVSLDQAKEVYRKKKLIDRYLELDRKPKLKSAEKIRLAELKEILGIENR